jgi:nucleoside-triphosphatase THEP1
MPKETDIEKEPTPKIAAIAYSQGHYPDQVLERVVRELQAAGIVVAGVLQHDTARRDRTRCDMSLENISSGDVIGLSEDRGAAARGCRIDERGLTEVAPMIDHALETLNPALLVVNKFGKIEAEGRGLRECILKASLKGIPVLIGVPKRNLDAWFAFAGEFSTLIEGTPKDISAWLHNVLVDPGIAEQIQVLEEHYHSSELDVSVLS